MFKLLLFKIVVTWNYDSCLYSKYISSENIAQIEIKKVLEYLTFLLKPTFVILGGVFLLWEVL
ncbi:hypothetical protein B9T19_05070 [Ignatzschineria sp. F8392]|nr:hypothetical protein B9T19_05070 [Ignatzschineria sp. F8392]